MTRPVFIAPSGYPRFCRWLTIGAERHITACLATISASESVIVTAQRPADAEICAACREDLRVREARGDDMAPYVGEVGVRAGLRRATVDTVEAWSEWWDEIRKPDGASRRQP